MSTPREVIESLLTPEGLGLLDEAEARFTHDLLYGSSEVRTALGDSTPTVHGRPDLRAVE